MVLKKDREQIILRYILRNHVQNMFVCGFVTICHQWNKVIWQMFRQRERASSPRLSVWCEYLKCPTQNLISDRKTGLKIHQKLSDKKLLIISNWQNIKLRITSDISNWNYSQASLVRRKISTLILIDKIKTIFFTEFGASYKATQQIMAHSCRDSRGHSFSLLK